MCGLRLVLETRGRSANSGAAIKPAHIWHAIGTDTWELPGYQTARQSADFLAVLSAQIRLQNTETITELAERTKTFFQAVSFCNTHPDQAFQQPIDVFSRRLIGSE